MQYMKGKSALDDKNWWFVLLQKWQPLFPVALVSKLASIWMLCWIEAGYADYIIMDPIKCNNLHLFSRPPERTMQMQECCFAMHCPMPLWLKLCWLNIIIKLHVFFRLYAYLHVNKHFSMMIINEFENGSFFTRYIWDVRIAKTYSYIIS